MPPTEITPPKKVTVTNNNPDALRAMATQLTHVAEQLEAGNYELRGGGFTMSADAHTREVFEGRAVTLRKTGGFTLTLSGAIDLAPMGGSEIREVTIPACLEHMGFMDTRVRLRWVCPECGGPRGPVERGLSFDGSRRLNVDMWRNPCGHIDQYSAVRVEASTNGLNGGLAKPSGERPGHTNRSRDNAL